MSSKLSRREFLKLISVSPLLAARLPSSFDKLGGSSPDPNTPNVLFLVFDTLTARHVSLFGYRRETTPNLARFAERATVFHSHHSGGNFTSPGTASILTGTYPWTHRALHLHGTVVDSFERNNIFSSFASGGYYTVGFTHNLLVSTLLYQFRHSIEELLDTHELSLFYDSLVGRAFPEDQNTYLKAETRVLRGGLGENMWPSSLFLSWIFNTVRRKRKQRLKQEYIGSYPRGPLDYDSSFLLLEDAIDWIQTKVNTLPNPYFAYIHLFPPHAPYRTRREFFNIFDDGWRAIVKPAHPLGPGTHEDNLNSRRQWYDEAIAYVDAEFGRLYDFMQESGALENTYLVFTSDHGEMFERGIRGHWTPTLYQPVLHVPLLISRPGQQVREDIYSATSSVDLLPTLLHACGQPIPDFCEGEVLPTFDNREPDAERSIFAVEAKSNPKQGPLTTGTVSMVKGQHKLIHYFGYPEYEREFEFYDLANDPEEMVDLYSPNGPTALELQHELEEMLQNANLPYLR